MKIEVISSKDKQATYELIFSHMSELELDLLKTNNPTAHQQVTNVLDGKEGVCFIAKDGALVIGYLLAGNRINNISSIRYAELREMRVQKEYRRRGVGSLLVERFIQWAKDEGYERMSVDVYALSERNVGFYQNLGFAPKTLTMEHWVD